MEGGHGFAVMDNEFGSGLVRVSIVTWRLERRASAEAEKDGEQPMFHGTVSWNADFYGLMPKRTECYWHIMYMCDIYKLWARTIPLQLAPVSNGTRLMLRRTGSAIELPRRKPRKSSFTIRLYYDLTRHTLGAKRGTGRWERRGVTEDSSWRSQCEAN